MAFGRLLIMICPTRGRWFPPSRSAIPSRIHSGTSHVHGPFCVLSGCAVAPVHISVPGFTPLPVQPPVAAVWCLSV